MKSSFRRFFNGLKKAMFGCWHIPGEWAELKDPDLYTTPIMYRAGLAPTHIRSCRCGRVQELSVQKRED